MAELPMGQQMQVDFGQTTLKNVDRTWTKFFVAAFLLSQSIYKYAQCRSRPFTAVDLVADCHNCFRYGGGMPREMVFDQNRIVCVGENSGDIIHTYELEKFRQDCRMEVYLCRGADSDKTPLNSLKGAISIITACMWMTRFLIGAAWPS